MWLSVLLVLVSVSVLLSPSMCLDDIYLSIGSCVATFWKRAAHSVIHMFSVFICLFVILIVSHFGFSLVIAYLLLLTW